MPEICRFYGIIIRMFVNDHLPPHFHAVYSGQEVVIEIDTLAIIAGKVAPRAMGLISEWAALHQEELMALWRQARSQQPLGKLEPLR